MDLVLAARQAGQNHLVGPVEPVADASSVRVRHHHGAAGMHAEETVVGRDGELPKRQHELGRLLPRGAEVLLPGTDAVVGEAILKTLNELIEINNQYYPETPLGISAGIATSEPGDRLEQVVKRADMKMLRAKRLHYIETNRNRRKTSAA